MIAYISSSNYIQIRTKLPIKPEIKLNDMLEKISNVLAPSSTQVINEDGFKFIFDENSWALVRPSNTEHVLRISLESEKNRSNSLYKSIYNKISEIYEKLFDEKQILNLIISTLDVAKVEPLFGKDDISLISFDKVSKNISNKDNYLAITCDMLVEHTDVPPKMTFKQIARKSSRFVYK